MSARKRKKIAVALPAGVLAAVLAGGGATAGDAESRRDGYEPSRGLYFTAGVSNVAIGGDMNGHNFVQGGGSAEILPDAGSASGLRFGIGYQTGVGDIEASYESSDHDGTWEGLDAPSEFRSLNVDSKLGPAWRVRPYGLAGFSLASVTVKNGSTDGVIVQNAKFKGGFGLRVGGGVVFAFHPRIGLDAQAVYRWDRFNSVDGVVSGEIEDKVNANGITMSAGLRLLVGKKKR